MLLLEAADLERIVCRLNGSRYVRARVCVCLCDLSQIGDAIVFMVHYGVFKAGKGVVVQGGIEHLLQNASECGCFAMRVRV